MSNIWLNGVVHWFDSKSGEGMVKADDGNLIYIHYSAASPSLKIALNTLKDGNKIQYQLENDVTFIQVSKVKEV